VLSIGILAGFSTPKGLGRTSVSDAKPDIDVGTILTVRTTDGNLAKLEVTGFNPLKGSRHENAKYHMRLRYVLYKVSAFGSAPLN